MSGEREHRYCIAGGKYCEKGSCACYIRIYYILYCITSDTQTSQLLQQHYCTNTLVNQDIPAPDQRAEQKGQPNTLTSETLTQTTRSV